MPTDLKDTTNDAATVALLLEALEKIATSLPGGHWDGCWYRLDPEKDFRRLREIASAALDAAHGRDRSEVDS